MTSTATSPTRPAAASTLLTDLLSGSCALHEVVRTRSSVHFETGRDDVPVLCLALPDAVRLPNAVLTPTLPEGTLSLVAGRLRDPTGTWQVTRWWSPPRPSWHRWSSCPRWSSLSRPDLDKLDHRPLDHRPLDHRPLDHRPLDHRELEPDALVGAGQGLTPEGDDLLAAALVTARATSDPRWTGWRHATRAALERRRTTAVSRALLTHAMDGWCIPQLADYCGALCRGTGIPEAEAGLLAVGHSSGRSLRDGVALTLATSPVDHEGAA